MKENIKIDRIKKNKKATYYSIIMYAYVLVGQNVRSGFALRCYGCFHLTKNLNELLGQPNMYERYVIHFTCFFI